MNGKPLDRWGGATTHGRIAWQRRNHERSLQTPRKIGRAGNAVKRFRNRNRAKSLPV